jgi:hypothetical protein
MASKKKQSGIKGTSVNLMWFWCNVDVKMIFSKSYQSHVKWPTIVLMSKWLAQATSKWYQTNKCNFDVVVMWKWLCPSDIEMILN